MSSHTPTSYNPLAKAFHWLLALAIIGMLLMGLYMEDLPFSPWKFELFQIHKSVGITILLLVAVRLLWRLTYPAPMLPAHMPLWQKAAAHTTHLALYGLMFAMPITGYLMSDAAGYHPNWFGLNVPILMSPNPEAAKLFSTLHGLGANLFWFLLATHVGAALYHHVWVKDDTLRRMLPKVIKL